MELIELYVKEVGEQLPGKLREDIQKEIRSMIEDTLEDEANVQGKPVDDSMVVEVLKRLGPPQKMADSYLPPKYLIGPALYPHFITTLRIVIPIFIALAMLGLGISLGWSARLPTDFARIIGQSVLGLFDSAFHLLGIVVLVFAIIQWATPDFKIAKKEWDPLKLKAEPNPERVKPAGQIVEIVLNAFAIIVFNLYPQWIGFATNLNGVWVTVPFLTAAFYRFLPWISLLWALEAVLHSILLSQGRWTRFTRWASIALNVFGIALGAQLLLGPALVNLDLAAMAKLGWNISNLEAFRLVNFMFQNSVRLAIGIVMAVQVVEIVSTLYKLLGKGRLQSLSLPGSG